MFVTTLNQMAVLALFMLIGFVVAKLNIVPDTASKVLSKLENTVFIPALVMGTFIANFTVETFSTAWKLLLFSLVLVLFAIPIAILTSKCVTSDGYLRKIYTYGLSFSNFGFMGIPLVTALFPEYSMYYVIFTLPMWTAIYVWGTPSLLMERADGQSGMKAALKNLVNPMFIALIIGAVIGISGLKLPSFLTSVIYTCSDCMSPIAMIITGMAFATIDIKKILKTVSIYVVSVLRLIVIPCAFVGLYYLFIRVFSIVLEPYFFVFLVCGYAMPLGLNTVVIPASYGKDTSVAAGMALISHILSIGTIPLIMTLFL